MKDFLTWGYGPETAFKDRLAQLQRELAVALMRDITDTDFAALAGVTGAAMSKWKGGAMPSRENLRVIETLAQRAGLTHITSQLLEYGELPRYPHELPAGPIGDFFQQAKPRAQLNVMRERVTDAYHADAREPLKKTKSKKADPNTGTKHKKPKRA